MHSGVPQGAVIGPFLFLLFVNDLSDVLEALTLLFADDVKMVTSQFPYRRMGLVEEVGPTDQSYQMQLSHNRARSSPEIVLFPRWVWHPHPCIQISQASRGSDRKYVLPLLRALKPQIRLGDLSS